MPVSTTKANDSSEPRISEALPSIDTRLDQSPLNVPSWAQGVVPIDTREVGAVPIESERSWPDELIKCHGPPALPSVIHNAQYPSSRDIGEWMNSRARLPKSLEGMRRIALYKDAPSHQPSYMHLFHLE